MTTADLVLEGGGAKLPGLVGAVDGLAAAGYDFHRIAGTSAGAIVGSLLAAGLGPDRLAGLVMETDFARFEDEAAPLRFWPDPGKVGGLLFAKGMYTGDTLHYFLHEMLGGLGIRTSGDLRIADPSGEIPPERRYRLVVIVSDVSRGRMLRLPWDFRTELGVDPDRQSVVQAICASAASPFFFQPRRLRADPAVAGYDYVLGADGGLLSNFPVDVFDRKDHGDARWPTLGVMLSARSTARGEWRPNASTLQYAKSVVATMLGAHDRRHIDDLSATERTVFVDTTGHSSTDFHLSDAAKRELMDSGAEAAARFLQTWDWDEWRRKYRGA